MQLRYVDVFVYGTLTVTCFLFSCHLSIQYLLVPSIA